MKRDYNSTTNQHIKGLLVTREVYHCQTSVVEKLFTDNIDELYELPNMWHYRTDLSDGEFIGDEEDKEEKQEEIETKIAELEDLRTGLITGDREKDAENSGKHDEITAQIDALEDDLRELDNDETEPAEIFEWWLISDWMGRKLSERGEVIYEDYGCTWWGRQCTGQAILLDYVVSMIAEEMEILDGMASSWADRK